MGHSFDRITKVRDEYLDLVKSEGKKALKEFVKEFFDSTDGQIVGVRWRQYTPYFNDGEPCVFRLAGVYFQLAPEVKEVAASLKEELSSDYDDDFVCVYSIGKVNKKLEKACAKFEKNLEKLEDVLHTAFGDHAMITATPKKVDVEEYEHD